MLQTDGTAVSEERRGSKTKAWAQVRSDSEAGERNRSTAFPRDVRSLHYSRFDKRVGSSLICSIIIDIAPAAALR